jgi:hypothetical protein
MFKMVKATPFQTSYEKEEDGSWTKVVKSASFTTDAPRIPWPAMNEWANRVVITNTDAFVWNENWTERGTIFQFGLIRDPDPAHGNRPYMWSSNIDAFRQITKIDAIGSADGQAYLRSEVEVLPGWKLEDNYFITPEP